MVYLLTQHFPDAQTAASELSKPPPSSSDCPRCGSANTKFCYYNNYNKSQPRHFCKSCKRHWTKGGTLRNIPAGRRLRNKRPRVSAPAAVPPPRKNHLNSLSLSNDQSDMSDILYQALIRSSSPTSAAQGTILESNGTSTTCTAARNYNTDEFALSSFNSAPTSGENLDSTEESTVATSAAPPPNAVELWNWNEVDFLASLWDHSDAEMMTTYKPIFEGYYPR